MFFFGLEHGAELFQVVLGCHVAWSESTGCEKTRQIVRYIYTHGMICPPSLGLCAFAAASSLSMFRPVM